MCWSCQSLYLNGKYYFANYDEDDLLQFYNLPNSRIKISVDEFNIIKNRIEILNELNED